MPINAENNQNNQNQEQEQNANQPVTLGGSGGVTPSAPSRVAGFSSGQPKQNGSGRFTNLSKYINANQGAGDRIGNQIQNQVTRNVNQQTGNINKQNEQIRQNVDAGKNQINQGNQFNQQLTDIGSKLGTFQNMENRGQFDQGSQDAVAFTQQPNFNQFQNIQAGQGVDENALTQSQQQAQMAGENLGTLTQDNLNKLGTEQGRYELLRNRFAPGNRSYAAGNARLDQLLLQNSPSNVVNQMQQNFQGQNRSAQDLNQNILSQGQNVSGLIKDESDLLNNLNAVTTKNQDLFNQNLGKKENIDYINKLREDKYNEYLNQLKTGNIGQDLSSMLGLNDLYTYQPGGLGINPVSVSQKMSREDIAGANRDMSGQARQIVGYNTDLANNAANYLAKGRSAQNMQDIATDEDFAAYNALANIAKRDTGALQGSSTLDKAVQAKANSEGRTLADVIGGQDQLFKNTFGGKNFSSYAMGRTAADDRGNFLENTIGNIGNIVANTPANLQGILQGIATGDIGSSLDYAARQVGGAADLIGTGGTAGAAINDLNLQNLSQDAALRNLVANDRGGQYNQFLAQNTRNEGGQGTAAAMVNIDDYIRNGGNAIEMMGGKTGKNYGASAANSRQAVANAFNSAREGLTSGLDKIINQTGVKNKLNINQDDSQNEILNKAKRFGRLV